MCSRCAVVVVVHQTRGRLLRMRERGKHQTDVWASKCRLRICSGAKIWSRRHFNTNRPYCVCTQKNRHKQFSQWYILTCAFPLCTIAARWPACVCVFVSLGLGTNSESTRKAWEVVYQQNSPQTKCWVFFLALLKGNTWRGSVASKGIKNFVFHHDNSCQSCTVKQKFKGRTGSWLS